jgi:Mce-associated membrane protein
VTAEDIDTAADKSIAPIPPQRLQNWLAPVILVVLLVTSAGVASWLYFTTYRDDQQIDPAARQTVLTAAGDGAVALLSYAPETLVADFANAKSRLAGDFLDYYTKFTTEIVTPAAEQKQVRTSAAVVRKAIMSIEPDSAEVLLFLNQNTVSKENPGGAYSTSAVKVSLEKHDSAWLISAFDPL